METIHIDDLNRRVKLNEIEAFTADQLKTFAEENMNEITKSQGAKDELMKAVADEIRTFIPYKVIGADHENHITEQVMFLRRAQVDWDNVEGGDIQKARGGTYLNTPENIKLGRAGKKYGAEKKEQEFVHDKGKNPNEPTKEDYEAAKKNVDKELEDEDKMTNKVEGRAEMKHDLDAMKEMDKKEEKSEMETKFEKAHEELKTLNEKLGSLIESKGGHKMSFGGAYALSFPNEDVVRSINLRADIKLTKLDEGPSITVQIGEMQGGLPSKVDKYLQEKKFKTPGEAYAFADQLKLDLESVYKKYSD